MKRLLLLSGLSFCLSACSGVDFVGGGSDHADKVAKPVTQPTEKRVESSKQAQQATSVPSNNQLNQAKQNKRVNQVNNDQTSVLDRYLTNRLTASMRDAGDRMAGQRPPIYYQQKTGKYYYGRSGAANYHFNQYLSNH